MEEERPNEMEMAKKENERGKEKKKTPSTKNEVVLS